MRRGEGDLEAGRPGQSSGPEIKVKLVEMVAVGMQNKVDPGDIRATDD